MIGGVVVVVVVVVVVAVVVDVVVGRGGVCLCQGCRLCLWLRGCRL